MRRCSGLLRTARSVYPLVSYATLEPALTSTSRIDEQLGIDIRYPALLDFLYFSAVECFRSASNLFHFNVHHAVFIVGNIIMHSSVSLHFLAFFYILLPIASFH